MRILLVEDEINLAQALTTILKEESYQVDMVHDGQEAVDYATAYEYDLMILDVMLPKLNGFEVLSIIRKRNVSVPVLMLTAMDDIKSKVNGLDSGADDYMAKPFDTVELLARMRALLRRTGERTNVSNSFLDLSLDVGNYMLSSGTKKVRLSQKENEVMAYLLKHGNQVSRKEQMLITLWENETGDNNVEVYISLLRKKILFLHSRVQISVQRGVGYFLEEKDV